MSKNRWRPLPKYGVTRRLTIDLIFEPFVGLEAVGLYKLLSLKRSWTSRINPNMRSFYFLYWRKTSLLLWSNSDSSSTICSEGMDSSLKALLYQFYEVGYFCHVWLTSYIISSNTAASYFVINSLLICMLTLAQMDDIISIFSDNANPWFSNCFNSKNYPGKMISNES